MALEPKVGPGPKWAPGSQVAGLVPTTTTTRTTRIPSPGLPPYRHALGENSPFGHPHSDHKLGTYKKKLRKNPRGVGMKKEEEKAVWKKLVYPIWRVL